MVDTRAGPSVNSGNNFISILMPMVPPHILLQPSLLIAVTNQMMALIQRCLLVLTKTSVFFFLISCIGKGRKYVVDLSIKGILGKSLTYLSKPCYINEDSASEKLKEQRPEPLPVSTEE